MPFLIFQWSKSTLFTPQRDQEISLTVLKFIGTDLLALEDNICYFKAPGFCAMKQVSHCYFFSPFFFNYRPEVLCVPWTIILLTCYSEAWLHSPRHMLVMKYTSRVVVKWGPGRIKLESELMPAKRPYLYLIIIIMFNKQSLKLHRKGNNQRHNRGAIKEML